MTPTADQLAEQVLVLDAQAGSAASMGRLIERRQAALYRHALRLTGDPDLAWDVLQEACLAMVRSIQHLHDPAAFRGWAHRLVSNKAADAIRRRQRRRRLAREAAEANGAAARSSSASDSVAIVRSALRGLSPDRRTMLELHYLDGLAVAEIATVLGIPTGTVKSRLHHARRAMKDALDQREKG